jgi:hypothetical protein
MLVVVPVTTFFYAVVINAIVFSCATAQQLNTSWSVVLYADVKKEMRGNLSLVEEKSRMHKNELNI